MLILYLLENKGSFEHPTPKNPYLRFYLTHKSGSPIKNYSNLSWIWIGAYFPWELIFLIGAHFPVNTVFIPVDLVI